MNADAEHFIAYFIRSPWILILIALGLMLALGMIKGALRNRRYRRRALREKEYWRRKFESELPQILNRNRQIRELSGPEPVPLLDHDPTAENDSYVLSGEVLAVNHNAVSENTDLAAPDSEGVPTTKAATDAPEQAARRTAQQAGERGDDGFDVFNLPLSHPDSFVESELDSDSDEEYDRRIRIVR